MPRESSRLIYKPGHMQLHPVLLLQHLLCGHPSRTPLPASDIENPPAFSYAACRQQCMMTATSASMYPLSANWVHSQNIKQPLGCAKAQASDT